MKLKVTNKFTADVLELEGTEEELTAFMQKYRPGNYNNYPWWGFNNPIALTNVPNVCLHDFDYNSTYPTCKKCGAAQIQFQPWVTTNSGGLPTSGYITTNEGMDLKNLKGVTLSGNSEAMAAN
jgi:hypothetical protein